MTRYVGLDVHKRWTEVCILSAEGRVAWRERVATEREALVRFARNRLQPTDRVALEATTNTWAVVDVFSPWVAEVVVSNPLRTRAIASAKVKTDRIDARVLAELLRCGYLPHVWQPDEATRRARRRTHHRAALSRDRTRLKNRIHAHLAQRLIVVPCQDLFSVEGRRWLEQVELEAEGRAQLEADLRLLAAVEAELIQAEQHLAEQSYAHEDVRLLMSLPGVDVTVAHGVMAAWGDVARFPNADRAASYLGLAPSTRQTGPHCYHGPITKQGNAHARWLLVQAAQHLDRHPGPLGVFLRRLAKKKGRNVAVVAAAHKLAVVAWHMLRNREPYRYAQPAATQNKLARLRVRATGQRHRGGLSKGSRRSAAYGTGQRTRKVPSLPEVYESEALLPATPLSQLPPGEIRNLKTTNTFAFVQKIQQPELRVRRRRKPQPADGATSAPAS